MPTGGPVERAELGHNGGNSTMRPNELRRLW